MVELPRIDLAVAVLVLATGDDATAESTLLNDSDIDFISLLLSLFSESTVNWVTVFAPNPPRAFCVFARVLLIVLANLFNFVIAKAFCP